MDEVEGPGGPGSFSIVKRQAPEPAQPSASDTVEGSGPDGAGAWSIVRGQTPEQAQTPLSEQAEHIRAVALIGTQMDGYVTEAMRRNGITEALLHQTYQRGKTPPGDFVPGGLMGIAGADRLPWLRRAVRQKVQAVCGDGAPSFEGEVPQGEIPEEYAYVGDLIDAVRKVSAGEEEKVSFLTTPLQFGPDAQVDARDRDVALLLRAGQANEVPMGLIITRTPSIFRNRPTEFGVKLEIDTNPPQKTVSYAIVPNGNK